MTTAHIHRALLAAHSALQPIHYITVPCGAGKPVENFTNVWRSVTCGGCIRQQPLDTLWTELSKRLAEEQAAQLRMSEMITELHELREKSAARVLEMKSQLKTIS